MAITILTQSEIQVGISEGGVYKEVPRSFLNPEYQRLLGEAREDIARDGVQYKAFPFSAIIGGYVVSIFSDGDAHASSDRQIMVRKQISDITNMSVPWQSVTFFENSTGLFDTSLLDDIMTTNEVVTFKVWRCEMGVSSVSVSVVSTVEVTGQADPDHNGTYALWSPVRDFGGTLYREGYSVDASGWNSAVFSTTDQTTWNLVGIIAKGRGSGLQYNEADIVQTDTGYLAVIREDSGTGRPLYTATSSDLISWSTPVLSTAFNGVQPNMIRLTNNTLVLAVGDRVGQSGFSSGGEVSSSVDTTGLTVYKSTDQGVTWSYPTTFDKSWSTDCGQPQMVETSSNTVSMIYYNALKRTITVTEPGIAHKVFTDTNII